MNFIRSSLDVPDGKSLFVERYRHISMPACGAVAFATTSLLSSNESIRIIAMTTLSGFAAAFASVYSSYEESPEFYRVEDASSVQSKKSKAPSQANDLENNFIRSKHRLANAFVWGAASSWILSALAGAVIAVASRSPIFTTKLSANSLIPFLAISSIATFVGARAGALQGGYKGHNFCHAQNEVLINGLTLAAAFIATFRFGCCGLTPHGACRGSCR